jgi:hypothetical protein
VIELRSGKGMVFETGSEAMHVVDSPGHLTIVEIRTR